MVNLAPSEFYLLESKFSQFLFKWASVEEATNANIYQLIAGIGDINTPEIDPRKVAFLERITGLDMVAGNVALDGLVGEAWDIFYQNLLSRFLIQGNFAEIFPEARYDFAEDKIIFNNSLDEIIQAIENNASEFNQSDALNQRSNSKCNPLRIPSRRNSSERSWF